MYCCREISKKMTDIFSNIFYLNVLGETLAYQVDQINTVLPHDTTYLGIEQNMDICTLVTCTPLCFRWKATVSCVLRTI